MSDKEMSQEEILQNLVEQMKQGATEDDILGLVDKISDEDVQSLDNRVEEQETEAVPEQEAKEEPEVEAGTEVEAEIEEPEQEVVEAEEEQVSGRKPLIEEIAEQIEKDPILKKLAQLSEEDRIAWAKEAGAEGLIKLIQLQKLETALMIERAKIEAQLPSLEAIGRAFYERNKELLEDDRLREIAKGLELAYMRELGAEAYWELNPVQLQAILKKVEQRLKEIAPALRGGSEQKPEEPESKVSEPQARRSAPSVGDIGAGSGASVSTVDILKQISDDPFKLEEALDKLPKSKLDDLLAELE